MGRFSPLRYSINWSEYVVKWRGCGLSDPASPFSITHSMTRATPLSSDAPRYFGRFELRQQLGQSIASQVWVVLDSHLQHEAVLCVPRVQPLNEAEREQIGRASCRERV